MPSLSYAITVSDEIYEIKRLINQLRDCIRPEDEIVIQQDEYTKVNEGSRLVQEYINELLFDTNQIKFISFPLNKDFATFKNNLKSNCTKDWIFFIDADEYLSPMLKSYLPNVLESNSDIDVLTVPRINIVNGITDEHIQKWRWRVTDKGWINWPDVQTRICKNKPNIKWEGKVHERLVGWNGITSFPYGNYDDAWTLLHIKDIAKQEKQNEFYNTI